MSQNRERELSNRTKNTLKHFAMQLVSGDRFAELRLSMLYAQVEAGDEKAKIAWDFVSDSWQNMKLAAERGWRYKIKG